MEKVRIEAPKHLHPVDIAQAILKPYQLLLKAEHVKYSERTFSRYKALREMAREWEQNYKNQVDKIIKEVRRFIEKKIILGSLDKAQDYKPLITPEQLAAIQQLIRDYHLAFIVSQLGPQYITAADVQRLIDLGVLPQDLAFAFQPAPGELPPASRRFITDAYHYGVAMGKEPFMRQQANEMSAEQFRKRKSPPLSPQEKAARTWANQHAAEEIKGLGNTVADDFTTIAINGDAALKAKYQQAIREEIDINLERRETWRQLSSELGHKSGDWARGFKRIAATEKQMSMQEGFVAGLIDKEGDPSMIYVAKQPNPDACPDCIRLHLTGGPGSAPRVFKLSTLIQNGTNAGRRRNDWKAVVGVVHPWCWTAGHLVKTQQRGDIPIEQIKIGDMVWTHLARWRRVERLSKRFYRGDIIETIVGDKLLKTTPKHPFFSPEGITEAQALSVNGYLFTEPKILRSSPKNLPSDFIKIGFLRCILRSFASRLMPMTGINFDRKLKSGISEVAIKRTDRELWNPRCAESSEHDFFMRGRLPFSLMGLRSSDFLGDRARFAANCIMRSLRDAMTFFLRTCGTYQFALLANGSNPNAVFSQSRCESDSINSIFSSERRNAFTGEIATKDELDWEFDSSSHDVAYRGVAVKSTRRVPFEGYIYNFAVEEDESYVCEGIVSHNCGCELIHVPAGWMFDDEGNLIPKELKRSDYLDYDLRKAQGNLTFKHVVPDKGCAIRVGDPIKVQLIEQVIRETPKELFDKKVGVTLVTEDHPRVQNPMDDHDLAYWTGNEIRLAMQLKPERLPHVLRHELAHGLNVYLMYKWGGAGPVRKWHRKLFNVSKREGFVSEYAKILPIENAAETTRFYLYDRRKLLLNFPSTFATLHSAYRDLWEKGIECQQVSDCGK